MDAGRYTELKKKKAVKMMSVGSKGTFMIGVIRNDPNGGAELEPEMVQMHRDAVVSAKKFYEDSAASCVEMLADMDALSPPAPQSADAKSDA